MAGMHRVPGKFPHHGRMDPEVAVEPEIPGEQRDRDDQSACR
jgi:hypothetical protein